MAPEQFHGKAVFASDLYSLGVTMYQMLTGVLPYDTPSPADLDRLMSGDLLSHASAQESEDPEGDQRHRRSRRWRRTFTPATSAPAIFWPTCWRARDPASPAGRDRPTRRAPPTAPDDIQVRLKAREAPPPAFAGIAANRSTRDPLAAPSAGKHNKR